MAARPASAVSVGPGVFRVGIGWFLIPFFAAGVFAMWPVLRRDAPITFWGVACGLYMLGAVLTIVVVTVLR